MADRILLSGYATIDYLLAIEAMPTGFGTWPATLATEGGWPRAGGAPLYAGARLAAHGFTAMPLVAIAPDTNGRAYRKACADHGLAAMAIADTAEKTACCVIAQHPSGRYLCFLDTGRGLDAAPTATQTDALADAHWVCIAAAPIGQTRAILDRLRPDQRLAWLVKADPACFPPDLCRLLSDRADIICHNRHECDLVQPSSRPDRITVETRGETGAVVTMAARRVELAIEPVACADATGCGDTFAGEFIAQVANGISIDIAAKLASDSVHHLLTSRNIK